MTPTTPTAHSTVSCGPVRWVRRKNGTLVLQQWVQTTDYARAEHSAGWRDVPTEDED